MLGSEYFEKKNIDKEPDRQSGKKRKHKVDRYNGPARNSPQIGHRKNIGEGSGQVKKHKGN